MNNSNWTGRTPRTTQQAFGPHAQWHRTERRSNYWIVPVVCAVLLLAYMVIV